MSTAFRKQLLASVAVAAIGLVTTYLVGLRNSIVYLGPSACSFVPEAGVRRFEPDLGDLLFVDGTPIEELSERLPFVALYETTVGSRCEARFRNGEVFSPLVVELFRSKHIPESLETRRAQSGGAQLTPVPPTAAVLADVSAQVSDIVGAGSSAGQRVCTVTFQRGDLHIEITTAEVVAGCAIGQALAADVASSLLS